MLSSKKFSSFNQSKLTNPKFLCRHRKGHSLFLTPIGSVYTLFFVVMSAHTLLGPFILILRLVDQTLRLDQFDSCHYVIIDKAGRRITV